MTRRICSHLLAVAAVLLTAQPALAADVLFDDPTQQNLEDLQPETPAGRWTVGVGGGYVPRYEGSSEHAMGAVPVVSYQRGGFSASATGVRYNFTAGDAFRIGPRVSFRGGRREDQSDHLLGLGDISCGVGLGVFARWRLAPVLLQADVTHGVGGPKGTLIALGVSHGVNFSLANQLVLGASFEWADTSYMQKFFGVDTTQSAASGLPAYSASAGVKNYGANLTWAHAFSPEWFWLLGVNVKQLAGDAADSPVVQQQTIYGVISGLAYRF